jgi:ribosomal protein S18 acetylase RimI-like enzyme
MHFKVRRARPHDAAVIAEFNRFMAQETEHKELDAVVVARGVARVFDDPGREFYLVAEADGEVIGQLMITYEWSDWRDGWFWWVQSVYVRADHRRRGVFRSLYDEVLQEAQAAGDVVGLRLYVERDNARAQATYQHLGMTDTGYLVRELLLGRK